MSKNKHFLVIKVMMPEPLDGTIEWVELEALFSKVVSRIDWKELRDETIWRQGWV